jgi:HEAT repeat protein
MHRVTRTTKIFVVALFAVLGNRAAAQAPPTPEAVLLSYGIPSTTPSLENALKHPVPAVRVIAAELLAERNDTDAIPLIQDALSKEQSPYQKVTLANSLATLKNRQGMEAFIEICNDETIESSARLQAANKVLDYGSNECTASTVMILENNPTPSSQALGLRYLRRITTAPEWLLPRLQSILQEDLKDPAPLNRQYASEALSVFGDKNSEAYLEDAIANEKEPKTRLHLKENLQRLQGRLRAN